MAEKIGSDVLGVQARREMEEKKKKELQRKLAEKKHSDDLNGERLPEEETPGSKPYERKLGEGADLINVRQHRRHKPRKADKETPFSQ